MTNLFLKKGVLYKKNVLNKYILKFLSETVDIEEQRCLKSISSNNQYPFGDTQSINCFSRYNSPVSLSLQMFLLPTFKNLTGLDLYPTYTYHRVYYNKAILEPHKDRPSCQYSATVCIKKGNHNWPIFFELKNKKVVEIEMSEGDVVYYKGCELLHWRNPYEGDRHTQIFLHYVDSNSNNKSYKKDKFFNNITNYS